MFSQVNKEGTVAIRRKASRPVTACAPPTDDEDPYGRLTNMKLTSFTEEQQMLQLQQQQESLFMPPELQISFSRVRKCDIRNATLFGSVGKETE